METRTAVAISGTAHAGLLVWALIGGLFQPVADDEALQVTAVSVMSNTEFDALIRAPETAEPETPVAPTPPQPREDPTPPPPTEETPPVVERPDPPDTAEPDPQPEVAILTPPPEAEVEADAPDTLTTPAEAPDAPESDTPAPREAPIISTTPAPAPPPATETAPEVQAPPEPSDEPEPEPVEPADEPAAPEETAPVIALENETPSAAPEDSPRPGRRPAAPTPVVQAEAPDEPSGEAPTSDPIQDAVREALETTENASADPAPTTPAGPPLTQGERDGLRVAVSRCWNLGSLSTEAMRTRVTIFMEMTQDGLPRTDTIRMIGFDGGSEAAARQAYEAGRRAIIRCGQDGFDLPPEKYEQWREIEMTFNPEQMRAR